VQIKLAETAKETDERRSTLLESGVPIDPNIFLDAMKNGYVVPLADDVRLY